MENVNRRVQIGNWVWELKIAIGSPGFEEFGHGSRALVMGSWELGIQDREWGMRIWEQGDWEQAGRESTSDICQSEALHV